MFAANLTPQITSNSPWRLLTSECFWSHGNLECEDEESDGMAHLLSGPDSNPNFKERPKFSVVSQVQEKGCYEKMGLLQIYLSAFHKTNFMAETQNEGGEPFLVQTPD